MHTLKADIKSTDQVQFEIAFTSEGDPWTDRVNLLSEDSGICSISINASDNRFWVMSTTDQYYQCSAQTCASTPTANPDSVNDWVAYITDDDPDDLFCTPHSTNTDY